MASGGSASADAAAACVLWQQNRCNAHPNRVRREATAAAPVIQMVVALPYKDVCLVYILDTAKQGSLVSVEGVRKPPRLSRQKPWPLLAQSFTCSQLLSPTDGALEISQTYPLKHMLSA